MLCFPCTVHLLLLSGLIAHPGQWHLQDNSVPWVQSRLLMMTAARTESQDIHRPSHPCWLLGEQNSACWSFLFIFFFFRFWLFFGEHLSLCFLLLRPRLLPQIHILWQKYLGDGTAALWQMFLRACCLVQVAASGSVFGSAGIWRTCKWQFSGQLDWFVDSLLLQEGYCNTFGACKIIPHFFHIPPIQTMINGLPSAGQFVVGGFRHCFQGINLLHILFDDKS